MIITDDMIDKTVKAIKTKLHSDDKDYNRFVLKKTGETAVVRSKFNSLRYILHIDGKLIDDNMHIDDVAREMIKRGN